jgi:hypothetical protein
MSFDSMNLAKSSEKQNYLNETNISIILEATLSDH